MYMGNIPVINRSNVAFYHEFLTRSGKAICACRDLPPQPDSQSDKASAVFLPAYTRIRHCRALYLYARFPFLCVICDVKQVSKALIGDELVVCGDNARVSPRCCVSLFLFPLQPPLLLQDFLPGNQTEMFAPSRYGSLLFYSQILC